MKAVKVAFERTGLEEQITGVRINCPTFDLVISVAEAIQLRDGLVKLLAEMETSESVLVTVMSQSWMGK